MQNLWVCHSFSPFLFFLIWYIICKDEYQIFKKHPFKISESMLQEETRMQNLWVWHSWLFLLFFPFFVSLFWNSYMIYNLQGRIPIFRRKKSLQDFWKHGFFRIFYYRIVSVAIFWGAPASLDSGIIGCFFPCFLSDARPLNSIVVLFICKWNNVLQFKLIWLT
jgi:hypothetical protein